MILTIEAKQRIVVRVTLCLCFLGKGILELLNYPMGEFAVSSYTKFHPLTYLSACLLVGQIFMNWSGIVVFFRQSKAALYYLYTLTLLFIYLILADTGASLSPLIDTLVVPLVLLICFNSYGNNVKKDAVHLACVLIMINSFLAIYERIMGVNVFPIQNTYGFVFRSTALLGHPLNNALYSLAFILYYLVINMSPGKKMIRIGILLIALVCFGARGCLYTAAISILMLYVLPVSVSYNDYFKRINKLYAISLVIVCFSVFVYMVLYTSFGERLMEASFFDDSADVRLQAISLLDFNSISEMLWAKSQDVVDMISYGAGVDIIENFFVVWILKFGLIFTVILLFALFYFLRNKNSIVNVWIKGLLLILFFVASATNNSLATNTQVLFVLVALFSFEKDKGLFVY
ncbi:hypothetical protein SAMN05421788_101570 [Filimonas lacunae]|uniref:O-Antigen ligase n=1 Tax=Filimonas lacunae TaxID=477680 RepID=A0A173MP28_9BACT|nr:VpsF family polysaccharide biosynthesis protein [Filimonas lacunae]BAV09128.1 hypothetical protein FLA_5176 [Filimonas lacunae]SIS67653.1 hypothetical protein SAMN05421788_101570 [Filimonas lacunae]